jgi:putative redox protein
MNFTKKGVSVRDATVKTGKGKFGQTIATGPHHLIADVPKELGGDDTGPEPHDFLLVALGACTSMTVKMYADRKAWPLEAVEVHLTQEKVGDTHRLHRVVTLKGTLDEEQRQKLMEIANKCPVHKTLTGKIEVQTESSPKA